MTADKPIKVRVDKIEGNLATLIFSDGQSFIVHKRNLPSETMAGDYVYLNLLNHKQLSQTKQQVAKAVLEEILR